MTHAAFAVIALAILVYVVFDFVREFRAAPGGLWPRLLAAGKGTETILWARFVALVGSVSELLVSAADYLNAPGVASAIQQALDPKYVAFGVVAIALITEWARRHNADDLK